MDNHRQIINSYIIEEVKFSLGTGSTYVCDYEGKVQSYYTYSNIKDVLYEARLGFPFYYVYIKSTDITKVDSDFLSKLRQEIGVEIGNEIIKSVELCIDFDATKKRARKK